ncbi:helix-turn-helix domain-containing protein [Nocardioides aquaticus]
MCAEWERAFVRPDQTAPPPDPRVRVENAWALLADQADAIADDITLTLFERDTEIYERFGPELRVDVRQSTRAHIRRGLGVLSGDRSQLGSARETWRETGRRRARQGVPLELVINAYITGARKLWEALVERSRTDLVDVIDADMLIRAGKAVWTNLDVQNGVLIEAYHRESARLQRQDLHRQQAVIDGLLEGRGADPDFAREAHQALGVGPDDPVACVVVLSDDSPADALAPAEDRLDRAGVHAFWHLRGGVYLGLLAGPLPTEEDLVEIFAAAGAGRVGLGRCAGGVAGFATAFQLATRAAETLPRQARGVVPVSGALPEVLLAGSPQMVPLLLAEALGPLLAQPDPQGRTLLDTLAALLRHDGSPTHAAEELYCHRNTVIYRLRQIEDLTGRTLADPRDKLLLTLAMIARGAGE